MSPNWINASFIAKEALCVADQMGVPPCADEYQPIAQSNWAKHTYRGRTVCAEVFEDSSAAISMAGERELIPAGCLAMSIDDFSKRIVVPAIRAMSWRIPFEIGFMV